MESLTFGDGAAWVSAQRVICRELSDQVVVDMPHGGQRGLSRWPSPCQQQTDQGCGIAARWFAHPRLFAPLVLLPLLAGCPQEEETGTTKPYAQGEAKPGAGVQVTAARANWDTGYFEAEVVSELLRELGYKVSPRPPARSAPTSSFRLRRPTWSTSGPTAGFPCRTPSWRPPCRPGASSAIWSAPSAISCRTARCSAI